MLRVTVVGAAGRMGRTLVSAVHAAPDMTLVGALENAGVPFLGQDAGLLAGCGESGVKICDDPAAALKDADAVIVFATGNVLEVVRMAAAAKISAVIGTTALSAAEKEQLRELTQTQGARIVCSPNMSVGVNLLFNLARKAAEILGKDYDVEIVEMHHNQKKDAPSGTAVRLGEVICAAKNLDYDKDVRHGRVGIVGARTDHEIGMHSLRGGDVVGDHTVIFATEGERVELTHRASSRMTFASGALRAVRFLAENPAGLYDMTDVLGLK
ncbi:MAG: 4-hydroxy-tetrahydrodipicolinate reductase [Victivallaceae bacterium]|nr:4-hydroxy-tetrahydrodipicolinate reductase [Victivallaceae bacterium]